MNEKHNMEILYQKYLENKNRILNKDGHIFYKIVKKDKVKLKGGVVLITVPREAVSTTKDCYYDETGRRIFLDTVVHMNFRNGEIPKWYLETVTVIIKDLSDVSEVGEYLR